MTSAGTRAARRQRERCLTLLALLAGAAAGIGATIWFAVGSAAEQPKTIAFAIAREPAGAVAQVVGEAAVSSNAIRDILRI